METKTKIKLSGVALVIGCLLFTLWTIYLFFTNLIASGELYGIFAICMWSIMTLYFGNEVRKTFKKEVIQIDGKKEDV